MQDPAAAIANGSKIQGDCAGGRGEGAAGGGRAENGGDKGGERELRMLARHSEQVCVCVRARCLSLSCVYMFVLP